MSTRKATFRVNTPGSSASKSSVKAKTKPPTPKQALNSTTTTSLSRSPPRLKGNLNVNSTFSTIGNCSIAAPKTLTTDWSLECDFAYSKYLRALITKDLAQEAVKQNLEALDYQLSHQAELLYQNRIEQHKLENEVEDLQIQGENEELTQQLEQVYGTIIEILDNYKVEENVKTYIAASKNACNTLYLKNIKPFTSQQDYDRFSALLQSCTATLQKLLAVIGNIDDVCILGEHVQKFLELQEEFLKKQETLLELQTNVGLKIFKDVSNRLSILRGYDEE